MAVATGAGFGGSEAIDQALPEIAEKLKQDGFDAEKWWGMFGPSAN